MSDNKFSLLLAAALLFVLSSCEKAGIPQPAGEISIDASIGALTKVSYSGNATEFTSGDKIAVFAWTGDSSSVPDARVVDGAVNTFVGGAWTPASPMLWKAGSDAHYFLGVFPAPQTMPLRYLRGIFNVKKFPQSSHIS